MGFPGFYTVVLLFLFVWGTAQSAFVTALPSFRLDCFWAMAFARAFGCAITSPFSHFSQTSATNHCLSNYRSVHLSTNLSVSYLSIHIT